MDPFWFTATVQTSWQSHWWVRREEKIILLKLFWSQIFFSFTSYQFSKSTVWQSTQKNIPWTYLQKTKTKTKNICFVNKWNIKWQKMISDMQHLWQMKLTKTAHRLQNVSSVTPFSSGKMASGFPWPLQKSILVFWISKTKHSKINV